MTNLTFRNTDNDKAEFQRLYKALDELDMPLRDQARHIRPLVQTVPQPNPRGALSMSEAMKLQLRKRAVSYFHGAMLAINTCITDEFDRQDARESIIRLYNKYDGQELFQNINSLKAFGKELADTLEAYDISFKDIAGGEKVANLERERPNILMSTSQYGLITEAPQSSHMQHKDIQAQYDFILDGTTGLRSKILNDYSLENRQALIWYDKKWVITKQLLKVATLMGVAFAKCGLSTTPVFSWFVDRAEKVAKAKTAKNALVVAKAPHWFKKQNQVVQNYLVEHAGEENLPAIPPTLRGIPGLPNMTIHQAYFGDGEHKVSNTVIRHGTLTPYEIENPHERRASALANGNALSELIVVKAKENFVNFWSKNARDSMNFVDVEIPTADLSFMSPYPGMRKIGNFKKSTIVKIGKLTKAISKLPENLSLFHDRLNGFAEDNHAMKRENKEAYLEGMSDKEGFNPSAINLGINGDRWYVSKTFESEQYQDQVRDTLSEFKAIKTKVEALKAAGIRPFQTDESANKYKLAIQAAAALKSMNGDFNQSYFSSAFSRAKARSGLINAELFASCLYAIVVQGMGGTVSACCKSSKDRTGLFLLHLDAMHAYYAKTGDLIDYKATADSVERTAFIEIMADLYIDNVQQTMASQATYGASGLKEPNGLATYLGSAMEPLPADLEAAVNRKAPNLFQMQKSLAGTNKLKI